MLSIHVLSKVHYNNRNKKGNIWCQYQENFSNICLVNRLATITYYQQKEFEDAKGLSRKTDKTMAYRMKRKTNIQQTNTTLKVGVTQSLQKTG